MVIESIVAGDELLTDAEASSSKLALAHVPDLSSSGT